MAAAARAANDAPHIPVLLDAILEACAPIGGVWLDGTFGAGGYARQVDYDELMQRLQAYCEDEQKCYNEFCLMQEA